MSSVTQGLVCTIGFQPEKRLYFVTNLRMIELKPAENPPPRRGGCASREGLRTRIGCPGVVGVRALGGGRFLPLLAMPGPALRVVCRACAVVGPASPCLELRLWERLRSPALLVSSPGFNSRLRPCQRDPFQTRTTPAGRVAASARAHAFGADHRRNVSGFAAVLAPDLRQSRENRLPKRPSGRIPAPFRTAPRGGIPVFHAWEARARASGPDHVNKGPPRVVGLLIEGDTRWPRRSLAP